MRVTFKHLARLAALLIILSAPAQASLLQETTIPNNTGVNIHFLDKDMEQHITLLKEAGFGWVRKDLSWANIEQQKGVYDFTKYDRLIDALNDAGIKVLLILDYSNPAYDNNLSPYTTSGRQGFVSFAEAAAKHYAHKNVAWEIYNEPNWHFWKPAPHVENYLALARIVTKRLRRTVPHQAILAPALAGPTAEADKIEGQYIYLKMVLRDKVAKNWDAISIHPYRGKKPPEDVFRDMPKLNRLLRSLAIKTPILFTEWGYHTSDKGVDEDTEAAYAVRSFLIANALRMPFSIWYNWQELGDDSSENEDKFGLLRDGDVDPEDTSIRKPAFNAVKELSELLNGYRYDKTITSSNNIFCMRFVNGKDMAYAIWTTEKSALPYTIALPEGPWRVKQILGEENTINIAHNKGSAVLQVDAMPLIVKPEIE